MNNSQLPHHENAEDELEHYLHERPSLLLKMLDIAESCWHDSGAPAAMHALPETRGLQRAS